MYQLCNCILDHTKTEIQSNHIQETMFRIKVSGALDWVIYELLKVEAESAPCMRNIVQLSLRDI